MKIYIITAEGSIVSVFTDKAKAEAFKVRISAESKDEMRIEEWDSDQAYEFFQYLLNFWRDGRYKISLFDEKPEAGTPAVGEIGFGVELKLPKEEIYAHVLVLARDRAHALKIGVDIRQKLLAENKWPENPEDVEF